MQNEPTVTLAPGADPKVLANIARFPRRQDGVTCLVCGYRGLMGLSRVVVPWYVSWPVIIAICATGVGLIVGALLGALRAQQTRLFAFCPACEREIGPLG